MINKSLPNQPMLFDVNEFKMQTACESDANTVETVVDDLKKNELLPDELTVDTASASALDP